MNRHQFRWDAFVFGLFFLAVLGQWAVWEMDWLGSDDLVYVAAVVLIVLGVLGIAGTAISTRSDRRAAPFTPVTTPDTEPPDNGTADDPADDQTTHGGNPT